MRVFVITLTALLLVVIAINAAASWLGRRHDARIQVLAARLEPGQAILVTRELDDRRLQRVRLPVIPRPTVVAFGSSRVMPLTGAALGLPPGGFYNAAVSAASVEDHIALWQLLRRSGHVPDVAIFSIDHWALAHSQEEVRWLALADLVREFLADSGREKGWGRAPLQTAVYEWARFKELFSYSVLRASVNDLERALRGRGRRGREMVESLRRDVVPEARVGDRRAVRADGSLIYERAYAEQTPEQVRQEAVRFARSGARGLFEFRLDPERLTRLELLWRDMRARGVELVVYLPPYHPEAWVRLHADQRAAGALRETAAAVAALAARVGARFLDASDPSRIPCGAEQFYDGDHARATCLRAILERLMAAPRPGGAGPQAGRAASALAPHRRFDVVAVGGDTALDDLEAVEHESQRGQPVAQRGRGVEPGALRAHVVEHQVPSRLERAVEMLEHGEGTGHVLEDLEAEDRVVEPGQRRVVVGLDRHHRHEGIVLELPARVVKEQVRDVGAHQLQVEVPVAPGERGQDRGRPASVLRHPAAARHVAHEGVHPQGR